MYREEMFYRYAMLFPFALILAGMSCLVAGAVMIYIGITGEQIVWLEYGSFKVYAGGFGAITMAVSLGWGYLATRTFLTMLMRQ